MMGAVVPLRKEGAMAKAEVSGGEAAERATRRRRLMILSGPFAAGLMLGGYVGFREFDILSGNADWPPAVAIGLAAAFLLSVLGASLLLNRQMDEVERLNSYRASSIAGTFYFIAYPVWFLLWKGGLVPEPMHGALFLGFWAILIAAYLYYRYR